MRVIDLPNVEYTAGGGTKQSQPLTEANLRAVLAEAGYAPRFDMARQEMVLWRDGAPVPHHLTDAHVLKIEDMCLLLTMRGIARVRPMLEAMAGNDRYHAFEDWLRSLPEPGGDPIGDMADRVVTDNEYWPIYLETWLLQVVEGVCGWRERAGRTDLPYCLVLHGAQGIGKTQFFSRLGGDWILTEADLQLGASMNAEESQLRVLRWPMVELAELDSITRKVDAGHMKAFLSRPVDQLRRKYARSAMELVRMTSFCATVNELEFLVDRTGNRRYLVVSCSSISWDSPVDMVGVWGQAVALWKERGFSRLTDEEAAANAEHSRQYLQHSPEHELLRTQYEDNGHRLDRYVALSATSIAREVLRLGGAWGASRVVKAWLEEHNKRYRKDGVKGRYCIPLSESDEMRLIHAGYPPVFLSETEAAQQVKWHRDPLHSEGQDVKS